MNTTFYIPINSNSLAHYFSKALILPSQYFQNKPEDIQNKLPNYILLSKNKWIKNSDCCIEVILIGNELEEVKSINENFYLLNMPLPISRIKQIFFLDKKQMDTTIWNVNNGAAFIPQRLVSIDNISDIEFSEDNFNVNETMNDSKSELEKKINRFDTALGGFAFMKVGGKDFTNTSMEFSENYFITLSHFNKIIEEQTLNAEKEKHLSFNRKYISLFTSNNGEWSKWRPYIYKNIEVQDVENIATKEGLKLEKKLGLLNIDSIDTNTHLYDIAIIATYGDRKNKSIDDLVNNLHNGIIPEYKIEDLCLLFGLNTGYSKFRNKYKTNSKEYNVKFKLDSKLDYYTIESIYQFAFNNIIDNTYFDFIDQFSFNQSSLVKISGFETYKILDKTIIAKKKKTPQEAFLESLSNIYEILSNSSVQFFPDFATIDKDKAIRHFKSLIKNELTLSMQQFEKNLTNEYKENFDNKNQGLISSYKNEIFSLQNENNRLKEEIFKLQKESNEEKITLGESINKNEIQIVVTESESEKNYESLSLSDLKEEANRKGIKGVSKFKKENKNELISLIKTTKEML